MSGACFWMALCLAVGVLAGAERLWPPVGPAGGDARSLAGSAERLYLGTTTGWIYLSTDGGGHWRRLAHLDGSNRLIVDHILIDPRDGKKLYAGAWRTNPAGGGLWVSRDAGASWTEIAALHGQSIRALALAPSDARVIVAGTLAGVLRSGDGGEHWRQISPPGSAEIHEVESLAVDPRNPETIYAGTWHLPWKTTDGGRHWTRISQGVIDDSDVFSIQVDPAHPSVVYLSACSGIYKSTTAGAAFRKIQGIPAEARRTRVLRFDPTNPAVVYAGTTEGLYKSINAGRSFRAITGAGVIVNDVWIDPGDARRVLLATDRGGVRRSTDGGASFAAANEGFSGRSVPALLVDRADARHLWAGVANDKEWGGAFESVDGGAAWRQVAEGLDGADVLALAETPAGELVAGTNHGVFVLEKSDGGRRVWQPRNRLVNTEMKAVTQRVRGRRVPQEQPAPAIPMEGRVVALDVAGAVWVAATSYGVVTSRDRGASWQGGMVLGRSDYRSVAVSPEGVLVAARGDGVASSRDGGRSWWPMAVPEVLTRITRVVFDARGVLWVGAREGLYSTPDLGGHWFWLDRLPLKDIDDLALDERHGGVVASSRQSEAIYAIDPRTMAGRVWTTGFRISTVRVAGDRLVAASTDDGVVLEPDSAPGQGDGW